MKEDDARMVSMAAEEKLEYQRYSLHNQRRIMSSFYRSLAILIQQNLVPREAVFRSWGKDDVKIVGEIIIPIEIKITSEYGGAILPPTDPLRFIADIEDSFFH